jgi:hypothetical protein
LAKKHGRYQMQTGTFTQTFGLSVSGFFVLTAVMSDDE